MDMEVTRVS